MHASVMSESPRSGFLKDEGLARRGAGGTKSHCRMSGTELCQ